MLGSDGTRLYVRTRGVDAAALGGDASGPRRGLICCDGILCDGYIYKWFWEQPPLGLPVVHWNYRGHGRSETPKHSDAIDTEQHASDLLTVIEHSGLSEVVLVGHSFGVTVVLEALRRRPSCVAGLVLISGTARPLAEVFRGEDKLLTFVSTLHALVEKSPRIARGVWSRLPAALMTKLGIAMGELSRDLNPEDIYPYFEHLSRLEPAFTLRLLHAAGQHGVLDVLPECRVPTLVLAGSSDSFVPPVESRRLAEALKDAQFHLIDGGSHAAPIEYPELVASKVERYLARIGFDG